MELSNLFGQKRRGASAAQGRRRSSTAIVVFSLVAILIFCASLASARYLPTRSDETRREHLKDALKLLFDLSNGPSEGDYQGLKSPRGPSAYLYEINGNQPSLLSKRSVREDGAPLADVLG